MPRLADEPSEQTNVDNLKTFRDRLMDRFAGHEYVRVINIDDEPFVWQYMPEANETFEFTPDPMKITRRKPAERYILNPGESEVILGGNAYVMVEALYKKVVAKNLVTNQGPAKPGLSRSFNWSDPQSQNTYIDKIYLGKEQPTFGSGPETKAEPKSEPKAASPTRQAN